MKNANASSWWRRLGFVAAVATGLATIVGSGGSAPRTDNPRPVVDSPPTDSRLDVQIDALGSGTISSVPAGIANCRSNCGANFTTGADVTLTAVPDAMHTFGRWTGACRGISPTTTVRMDASKTCSATFGPGWQLNPAQAKASDFADLQTAAALAADGRLLVGYIQPLGAQGRVGVLRESLESAFASVFVNLPDVNANPKTWSASAIDMALDASDQPILATLTDLGDVRVDQWSEVLRDWLPLSSRVNVSSGGVRSPQIGITGTLPGNQTVIVALVEAGQIVVRRYSTATQSWDAHAFIAGIANVRSVRMMLDRNGAPVIAYWTGTLNVIRETAPGVWTPLGGEITTKPTDDFTANAFGVHVDAADTVRVAWVEGVRAQSSCNCPWAIYARRFDGANWVSASTNNNTGFVFNELSPQGAFRAFPTSLVVARNPSVFAFATAWDLLATGNSEVRVVRVAANGLLEEDPVPIAENGLYRRATNVSLVMQDADRPVVTSSHYEPTVMPPYVLQVRREFP